MLRKNLTLRQITVWARKEVTVELAYLVYDHVVYYCATNYSAVSSINCAELIVLSIAQHERFDWRDYSFVDIQTIAAYPELKTEQGYLPGYYVADRLLLIERNQKPHVYGFELVKDTPFANRSGKYPSVPQIVEELFAAFIWKR